MSRSLSRPHRGSRRSAVLRRHLSRGLPWSCLLVLCLALQADAGALHAQTPPWHDEGSFGEELSAGDGTVFDISHNAFGRPLPQMDRFLWTPFRQGKRLFTLPFTSDGQGEGLGPLFNAESCSSCHFKDGRSGRNHHEPPLLVRLSVERDGLQRPEPVYGGQLQESAVHGVSPEGRLVVRYEDIAGQYRDGTAYSLRRPIYAIDDLAYGPLAEDVRMSVRMPPALVGLGFLEAIPEASILAHADPLDLDGDGISGRVNRVPDLAEGTHRLGRFGWKAGQPNLHQQTATALREDLGLDHPVLTPRRSGSAEPELSRTEVERLTLYTRLLAVPARRDWQEPDVLLGQALFSAITCDRCHRPRFETTEVSDLPALSHQVIRPYTDLLLHDMGEELADGRSEHLASGSEWRTPALWGLGLLDAVSGHVRLLHDGRARSIEEAILWHGGEAQKSRDHFVALSGEERGALLAFLESL